MGDSVIPVTYVLLIRHGENDYTKDGKLAGRTPGVFLNDKGREQSEALARGLAEQPFSAIYSSPMERCMQTAEPVAAAHGLEVIAEPGVLEVGYGQWQGGELKELSKSPEWQMVQHIPSAFRFPEGETLREVQARAVHTVECIRERHPNQLIAVFSHGDVIRTTLAHYLGVPIDLFQRIAISTASVSALGFHGLRPMVLWMNYQMPLPKFEFKSDEPDEGSDKSDSTDSSTDSSDMPGRNTGEQAEKHG